MPLFIQHTWDVSLIPNRSMQQVGHTIETISHEAGMPFVISAILSFGPHCSVWVSCPGTSHGPTGPIAPSEQAKSSANAIRMEVTLALVNVTVTDPLGRLVTGLEKENFRVYEDGIEQEIVSLSNEDVPVSIGLIFDMSGSMSDKAEKARQAAVQFLQTANPRDEFFLVSFGDRAELTRSFTTNIEDLQNGMLFTTSRGRTALFDAIYLGLSQMRGARTVSYTHLTLPTICSV